jgi:uncharacterized cupin superfamily protein
MAMVSIEGALQKYNLEFFDTLDWVVQDEIPDFATLNGTPTMKLAVIAGDGESPGTVAAWSCDKDGFTYDKLPTPEAAFLLAGKVRLTEAETGVVTVVQAGEGYRLPAGWSGTFEALEPVQKIYLFL